MGRVKPLAALSGLAGVAWSVVSDPFALLSVSDWVLANLDLLLPMFTTLAYRVAPHFDWIDPSMFRWVILALAVLFVLSAARKLARRTFG